MDGAARIDSPESKRGSQRSRRRLCSAFALIAAIGAILDRAGAGEAAPDAALETCRARMTEVAAALSAEPPLRDEAYTAIMWGRLDAEAAYAARDGSSCLAALDLPRRVLGLDRL